MSESNEGAARRINSLAARIATERPDLTGNICYSPLGAYIAIYALWQGARDKPRSRLRGLISTDNLSPTVGGSGEGETPLVDSGAPDTIGEGLSSLIDRTCGSPASEKSDRPAKHAKPARGRKNALRPSPAATRELPQGSVSVASGIWIARGYEINRDYLASVEAALNAQTVDLNIRNPDQAAQRLGKWVAKRQGHPSVLISGTINPLTRLMLINVVSFAGRWASPFKDVFRGTFHLFDDSSVQTAMMQESWWRYGYEETERYFAAELPYKSDNQSMIVILPKDKGAEALREVESTVVSEIADLLPALAEGHYFLTLRMPPFDIDDSLNLLQLHSVSVALSEELDLSGISDEPGLTVDQLKQNVTIHVDEYGTTATATTILNVVGADGEMKDLTLDRPFLFFIIDKNTGTILFLGRVVRPKNRRRLRYDKDPEQIKLPGLNGDILDDAELVGKDNMSIINEFRDSKDDDDDRGGLESI